ncbi:potassium uptake transporter gating subunit KtrA [Streptococcus porcinus]|uniref:TrkA N-terminal domain protein n=2 Tax=Streptococcus porcinus TaxID=1340 RepID=A0A4U9ZG39_STRPO|nr:potassium uptake transporter gating subunit KtrA [Streptococcus porcinus]EGJ26816.1 TrkA N-terminal domain protein [Streptococcus porcinus str. Jelinkova 176]MBA2796410.1 TrkA family potassium uptake protein [Streptococcus porcinus]SQG44978.1 TrkA N-terminal domain protein [Streptococcus porcinus]VTS38799.1 TrkA N-terminal domain protein [Streptococcus porcinus]VTT45628.1 TrkA N-terminal domain protein [Streptococcus porcinus]
MKRKTIGVLGLGIFGRTVARQLSQFDQDVIAIDKSEANVNEIGNLVTKAAVGDMTDNDFLLAVGIDQCDTVVIATGNNLEASVLAIMHCKKLEVPAIIAKAKNKIHEEVLYGIGATNVITPERDSGKRVASNILKCHIESIIYLEHGISMINFAIPESWVGKTLTELDVRQKYELNIIGTRHEKESSLDPNVNPTAPLEPNTILVAIANNHTFEKFDYLGYLK